MALTEFIASIDEHPDDDLLEFGRILASAMPEHADHIRSAISVHAGSRIATVRHVLKRILEREERDRHALSVRESAQYLHRVKPGTKRAPLTLEQQEDAALRKAQAALGQVTDAQWEDMALRLGKPAQDVRREAWAKVFRGYSAHD